MDENQAQADDVVMVAEDGPEDVGAAVAPRRRLRLRRTWAELRPGCASLLSLTRARQLKDT